MQKLIILILTTTFFIINGFSQDFIKSFHNNKTEIFGRSFVPESNNTGNYDLKYYRFNLYADPQYTYISGNVMPKFKAIGDMNEIYFDFNSIMTVDSVIYEGKKMNYEFSAQYELKIMLNKLIPAGSVDSLLIFYRGNPSSSGFGSFETGTMGCDNNQKVLWTLSEPYGARDWWPTKQTLNDKIDSVDLYISTPYGFKVGSNGLLMEVIQEGDKLIHHWKHIHPEPAYLIAIAVANYSEYIDWVPLTTGDSLMVLEYVYPCNLDYAKLQTSDIVPTMQFFIELFGDFPFEKYGHAQFGWGGGMEHSSMTFVGGFNHGLLAHELAHQWFGDKITCGSWQDIWLNEGFATYLEGLTYDFGRDPNTWEFWKTANRSRCLSSPYGSVFVDDTTSVGRIFSGSLSYAKGAFVLHMLRGIIGDEDFFAALRNYIHDPKLIYNYALTGDLQNHFENQTGMDLTEYFNDWVYGKGFPVYNIEFEGNENGNIWIKIRQDQSDPSVDFFEMPVQLRLIGNNIDTLVTLNNTEDNQEYELNVGFKVTDLEFDPNIWLCAKLETITSVQNIENENFVVYPNPASQSIFIKSNNEFEIEQISLLDLNGKLIFSQNNGMYVINLITSSGILNKKIIINR